MPHTKATGSTTLADQIEYSVHPRYRFRQIWPQVNGGASAFDTIRRAAVRARGDTYILGLRTIWSVDAHFILRRLPRAR
jgi:hypothetical protein